MAAASSLVLDDWRWKERLTPRGQASQAASSPLSL
ncbi:hypothetical protein [Sporisorium scitamineum]|uniref:Uncharacterized protein n=1 Tax=Sporisorium scitamineum TaxID=49012 RepID=A0A0F7RWN4_9BASI|nr:hypothetical protein [Sporisorium scitamineum]